MVRLTVCRKVGRRAAQHTDGSGALCDRPRPIRARRQSRRVGRPHRGNPLGHELLGTKHQPDRLPGQRISAASHSRRPHLAQLHAPARQRTRTDLRHRCRPDALQLPGGPHYACALVGVVSVTAQDEADRAPPDPPDCPPCLRRSQPPFGHPFRSAPCRLLQPHQHIRRGSWCGAAEPESWSWSVEGTLKAFFGIIGDPIARHNLPDQPSFTPVSVALFALGLATGLLAIFHAARSGCS